MKIECYCDGSARPNPGEGIAQIHLTIETPLQPIVSTFEKKLGYCTNVQAEYHAFLLALQEIEDIFVLQKPAKLYAQVFTDYKNLWGQLIKKWKVNENRELVSKAKQELQRLRSSGIILYVNWVPREQNLAGQILEKKLKSM